MEELKTTIAYWQNTLATNRFILNPSIIFVIEATICYLQALLVAKAGKK